MSRSLKTLVWLLSSAFSFAQALAQPNDVRNEHNIRWRTILGTQQQSGARIATDRAGNLFVTWVSDDFPPRLRKYSPEGALLWEQSLNGYGAIAVDSDGGIISTTAAGFSFAFRQYSGNGALMWSRTNSSLTFVDRIAISPERLFLIGRGGDLSHPTFITCDRSGVELRVHSFPESFGALALQLDPSGFAYVLHTATDEFTPDLDLSKYAPDGSLVWNRKYDSSKHWSDYARQLIATGDALFVAGSGPDGTYILKVGFDGDLLWQFESPSAAGTGNLISMAVAPDGGLVFASGIIVGRHVQICLEKLSTIGATVWRSVTHANEFSGGRFGEMVIDPGGSIFLGGDFGLCAFDPQGLLRWRRDDFLGGPLALASNLLYSCQAPLENFSTPITAELAATDTRLENVPRLTLDERLVPEGASAVFDLRGSPPDESTFQWTFNGHDIQGATNKSLEIPHTVATNSGTYGVIVRRSSGAVAWPGTTLQVAERIELDGRIIGRSTPNVDYELAFRGIQGFSYVLEFSLDLVTWAPSRVPFAPAETIRIPFRAPETWQQVFFRVLRL